MMKFGKFGQVTENIMTYMNAHSSKKFNYLQISMIRNCIKKEYLERKSKGIKINGKTKNGRLEINKRVATLVNQGLPQKYYITHEDVRLYKKCFALEYQDRTGKCAWGFPDVRERLGYDPVTGYDITVLRGKEQ